MPAIASINANQTGPFAASLTTLTAADTITFRQSRVQLLVLRNPTGATVTPIIKGNQATTVTAPGIGTVNLASGLSVPVAAGASVALLLSTVRSYLAGTQVDVTAGTGVIAQLFDL